MIGCFIALTLLVYAVYNIFTIDKFISNAKGDRLPSTEAVLLLFTYLWFAVHVFLSTGPIALVLLFILIRITYTYKKTFYIIYFIVLFLGVTIIMINQKIMHIEMWKYLFNLIF